MKCENLSFILFWPKKVYFEAKMNSFFHFYVNQLFSEAMRSTEKINLYNIRYLSRIQQIFIVALNVHKAEFRTIRTHTLQLWGLASTLMQVEFCSQPANSAYASWTPQHNEKLMQRRTDGKKWKLCSNKSNEFTKVLLVYFIKKRTLYSHIFILLNYQRPFLCSQVQFSMPF